MLETNNIFTIFSFKRDMLNLSQKKKRYVNLCLQESIYYGHIDHNILNIVKILKWLIEKKKENFKEDL